MAFIFDPSKSVPEIVVFEHINFGGHQFRTNIPRITNLKGKTYQIDIDWVAPGSGSPPVIATSEWDMTKKISSIIIISGTWQFYSDPKCKIPFNKGPNPIQLPPGYYQWVENMQYNINGINIYVSIPNDKILSFECVLQTLL